MENPFSIKLAEFIHADGRTVARICREGGGVSPVTLHAYKDGRRLPDTIARVIVVADALSLGKRDWNALCAAYNDAIKEQAKAARGVSHA